MSDSITETRVPGGPVIITDKMPWVRSATLGFFYKTGARHEPDSLSGISHFIEHTVFKGTEKRTALEIAIEQDRLGGGLDAFTTHEETGFAIKVVDHELATAFELLADMLTRPRFDSADLKSEQKVIIEEMKMVEDSPEEYLGEIFSEGFYPAHPLGRNIAGTPKTVRSFNSTVTRDYHKRAYSPRDLVIAAAGNITHEAIVELSEKWFSGVDGADSPVRSQPPTMGAPIIVSQDDRLEQAHMIIAAPLVPATDKRRYAADHLSNIVGGGTSSRLWQTVREQKGLAYSVGASYTAYQDCGMFSVFAATSPSQVRDVTELAIAAIRDVRNEGVTSDELELAKAQSRAAILLSLEDSASRAGALAQSEMIHGRQISVEETLAAVEAVTTDDVCELAREFFTTDAMAFAALGDLGDLSIEREMLRVD